MSIIRHEFSDLPPDWREGIFRWMGEGWSVTEVIAELGITRKTHARFVKEHEIYAETISAGEVLSEAWWVKLGRVNVGNARNFNVGIWAFNLKNRFGWRDSPLSKEGQAKILPDKTKEEENREKFRLDKKIEKTKESEDVQELH